jgi:hypothetical protein
MAAHLLATDFPETSALACARHESDFGQLRAILGSADHPVLHVSLQALGCANG